MPQGVAGSAASLPLSAGSPDTARPGLLLQLGETGPRGDANGCSWWWWGLCFTAAAVVVVVVAALLLLRQSFSFVVFVLFFLFGNN
jgi:hypothetical protein